MSSPKHSGNVTIESPRPALASQYQRRARHILRSLAFALTPEEEKRYLRLIETEIAEAVRQVLDEKEGRERRVF